MLRRISCRMSRLGFVVALLGLFVLFVLFFAHPLRVDAASLTVNTTADDTANDNLLSLREAINAVNAGNVGTLDAGAVSQITGVFGTNDTITFNLPNPSTITLALGTLGVSKDVTIQGPGASALAVSGGDSVGIGFTVNLGTTTLSGLTVRNTTSAGIRIFGPGAMITDCIFSNIGSGNSNSNGIISSTGGLVTVTNTVASGSGTGMNNNSGGSMRVINSTSSGNFRSIFNFGTGTMLLEKSTFNGNGTGLETAGTVVVASSTISGNTRNGIQNDSAALTVTNSTISNNATGIQVNIGKTLALGNSIVAGNTTDISGSVTTDQGHNVIGGTPLLMPLGNYGGSTQTQALPSASPAIDLTPAPCPAFHDPTTGTDITLTADQRGFPRLAGSGCDAGSVEFRGFVPTVTGGDGQSTLVTTPFPNSLALSLASNETESTINAIPVTFSLTTSGASATFAPLAGCTLTNGNLTATCPSNEGGMRTARSRQEGNRARPRLP